MGFVGFGCFFFGGGIVRGFWGGILDHFRVDFQSLKGFGGVLQSRNPEWLFWPQLVAGDGVWVWLLL